MHRSTNSPTQTVSRPGYYAAEHQLEGPPRDRPPAERSTPPNLSPLLLQANLLAVHPHHTLYKLPLHLTCPDQLSIIDEWVALRGPDTARGGGWGGEGVGLRARRAHGYYLNELTAPL